MPQSEPPRARPRIKDVARLAGVSPQTVSNVINGRGRLGEDTRSRVEQAITELGFQPNRYAQSLRLRRTRLIGFDLTHSQLDVRNPFALSFLRALTHAASERGHRVVVFTHDTEDAAEFRTTATAGLVDGFILNDAAPGDVRVAVLDELGVPFSVVGRTLPEQPQHWVDIDNALAMADPVDHLVARGSRTFAFLGYPTATYWDVDRLEGTRKRLAHHGLTLPDEAVVRTTPDELPALLPQLLAPPNRPDAIVTASDSLAVVVVYALPELGLRAGRDVAVTGFDAGPLRSLVQPALTSVRLPVDALAVRAVDTLMRLVAGSPAGAPDLLATDLVVGGTA